MIRKTVSFIIPAYNEEKNIESVIKKIHIVANKYCKDYEIIAIDDGSNDRTWTLLNKLAIKDRKIKVIHNKKNMGMGYSYFCGVKIAHNQYTMIVFGDNDHSVESMAKILSCQGRADIVIAYYKNLHLSKTWLRHVISITYTHIINWITGLSIAYYNGMTMYRTELLKKVPRFSSGFGFQAETIVYLIKNGAKYVEVDIFNEERKSGSSAAFRIKNVISVLFSFCRLTWHYKIHSRTLIK